MCGISGFNWKDEQKIAEMVGTLSHRGPDASGTYLDDNISLGHNRLAVIDLDSRSNQPMLSADGSLVIVYNGEIYNFKELKKELADYPFKTESDTEVILAGYHKWGKEVVGKLNGMFAFAIWDKKHAELFCVRDHAGVKPFYYYWDGSRFIFASDAKAIFLHNIPRKLDADSFNHYIRVLYAPEPLTMTKNVFKLPPQSTLVLKGKDLSVERYGRESFERAAFSYGEATSILRDKVVEAVGRQLVADVPVGVYLSGGIDSSAILFSMTRFHKNIKTFSVGFDLSEGEEREKFNRDFDLAAETSKFFGVEHHPLLVSARDAASSFEEAVSHMSDPISHPTSVAMLLLAKRAKKDVTVVLSGNGADELFGGYDRYRMNARADAIRKIPGLALLLPGKIRKAIGMTTLDRFAQFEFEKDWRLAKVVDQEYFESMTGIKGYYERYLSGGGDSTDALMLADFRSWLPDYSFMLSDKMSMASALEERVPFIDRELVEFSRSLPRRYKVDSFRTKKILKDAFRNDLPDYLFNQPKRGWFSPGAKWLRRPEMISLVKEILHPDYHPPTNSLFIWPAVRKMHERHLDKSGYNLTILWAILTFQVWARKHGISL